ncbi:MAG: N-6 DNA methylase, partial [Anaerolineales bacterium]|nr:N-6 DNA methylase [Anaerolineales bacterium]
MHPVERYLTELLHLHRLQAGTGELSAYPPLFALLTEIGQTLKPRVAAVGNLANVGAGHPDAGLFGERQQDEPIPERGVVEVKGPGVDVVATVQGEQVARYLAVYRQVLVTNYWHFALVQRGADGQAELLEQMQLAADEADFWRQAAHPRRLARQKGVQLAEFLQRVMLRPVAVSRPRDVAWFLASYARDALARLGADTPPGLAAVRAALEEALGLTFEGEKGDRFFRSTLIQTLFYGVFSAWVLWHKENPARQDRFDWRLSAYLLRVPVIQVLFEQLAAPSRLKALDLEETLTWVGGVLNRVDRGDFFSHFEEGEAVQYFYEPFLEAFSPQLRRELGVWYTPPEVVAYMVERVDTVLRTELGKPDGLADPDVVVLDPACGTGAYLSAVLDRIARTVAEKGETALAPALVKQAAVQRVFGFEILPAPYVIAHLQLGLRLQNAGAPLADGERAGIFLTNALTGWTPPEAPKQRVLLPELAADRDAAERVKQQAK